MGYRSRRRNDEGSLVLTLLVIIVSTTLLVAFLGIANTSLKFSRRSGDSANALEVTDAGVNDAVKSINAQLAANPATTFFEGNSSLGGAGDYRYTATQDGTAWRIDAVGTDLTGVKRHIKATAQDQDIFGNAFFALYAAQFKGTTDSFASPTQTCLSASSTPRSAGFVGSNQLITFDQNQGGGSSGFNCQQNAFGGFPYAADGCVFYEQTSIPPKDANDSNTIRSAACPPEPLTFATTQKFAPKNPSVPANALPLGGAGGYSCPASGDYVIPAGTWKTSSLTLSGGCYVARGTTSKIYVTGPVTIGTASGNCANIVNQPQGSASCGGSSMPSSWYESGWARNLQIFVLPTGGVSHSVTLANHATFWGVIFNPSGVITSSGGSPHVDIFGAVVSYAANSQAQFAFHYDVSLVGQIRTSQFVIKDWREEPSA